MIQGEQGLPIGGMSDENWASFYAAAVESGVLKPGLDIKSAYVLNLVK